MRLEEQEQGEGCNKSASVQDFRRTCGTTFSGEMLVTGTDLMGVQIKLNGKLLGIQRFMKGMLPRRISSSAARLIWGATVTQMVKLPVSLRSSPLSHKGISLREDRVSSHTTLAQIPEGQSLFVEQTVERDCACAPRCV
jgi:hypothetical protein